MVNFDVLFQLLFSFFDWSSSSLLCQLCLSREPLVIGNGSMYLQLVSSLTGLDSSALLHPNNMISCFVKSKPGKLKTTVILPFSSHHFQWQTTFIGIQIGSSHYLISIERHSQKQANRVFEWSSPLSRDLENCLDEVSGICCCCCCCCWVVMRGYLRGWAINRKRLWIGVLVHHIVLKLANTYIPTYLQPAEE